MSVVAGWLQRHPCRSEPAVSESERVHLVVEETQGIPGQGRWVSVQKLLGSHLLTKVDIRSGYPEQLGGRYLSGRRGPEAVGSLGRVWD